MARFSGTVDDGLQNQARYSLLRSYETKRLFPEKIALLVYLGKERAGKYCKTIFLNKEYSNSHF